MGKNEIGGLLRTERGFHIIKWVEKRNADIKPFEEAKEGLRNQLFEKRKESAIESWIKELRRKSYIEVKLEPAA